MKRTNILTALACALLVLVLAGCGASNKLQSITLGASLVNGVAPSAQAGFFTLKGNGGTIQLQATGHYSNSKTVDLSHAVTYTAAVDPVNNVDAFGNTLLPPCKGAPCPTPAGPPFTNGTVEMDAAGLVTAVDPATCTWVDLSSDPTKPAWFYSGAYKVTVSLGAVTSQPLYIPVASSAGVISTGNPTGACGPS